MPDFIDFQDLKDRVNIVGRTAPAAIADQTGRHSPASVLSHPQGRRRARLRRHPRQRPLVLLRRLRRRRHDRARRQGPRLRAEGGGALHRRGNWYCSGNSTVPGNSNSSPQPKQEKRRGFDAEAYAKGLDPAHAALAPLGIAAETFREWKAGYSASGVNRGRLALAIVSKDGAIVGYAGRLLGEGSPALSFPERTVAGRIHLRGASRHRGRIASRARSARRDASPRERRRKCRRLSHRDGHRAAARNAFVAHGRTEVREAGLPGLIDLGELTLPFSFRRSIIMARAETSQRPPPE